MKKFVYLALLTVVTVLVGCNKPAETPADTTTTPPATNPPAAK